MPHSCRAGGRGEARAAAPGKCRALLGLQPPATAPSSPQPPLHHDHGGTNLPGPSPPRATSTTAFGASPAPTLAKEPQPCPKTAPAPAPSPSRGCSMGPAVSPETPPHTPSTPPSTILVPLRQHPGDSTGRGDTGTRTRHCPSSPGPWAPPGPPPRHPTRVPGVSHGSHPGGLPWPPPAARGHAACPSARPALTGRAAEPAERAGAEAAVGATQRPGGRRFASLCLLKPGKKGKNCSVGLGAAWALGVVCDPAPWGPDGERRLSPHPAALPGTHARPRLAAQPLMLSTNTERGRSAAPGVLPVSAPQTATRPKQGPLPPVHIGTWSSAGCPGDSTERGG